MIKITSQDGFHQYDAEGRPITTWDAKKCAWIVNTEFENESIDWWGVDNDFPAGTTLAQFIAQNPNWDTLPDITVIWTWNTKERYQSAFGSPSSFGQSYDYYDKLTYPQTYRKNWGYIDCPKDEVVERFGKYARFNVGADSVKVMYNGKIVFDGKLL